MSGFNVPSLPYCESLVYSIEILKRTIDALKSLYTTDLDGSMT